LVYSIMVT